MASHCARSGVAWWEEQLDRTLEPGFFGENLTVVGVDVSNANVGDRWRIGTTVLEVSEPRVPCFKLGIRSGISRFQQTFSKADRPGTYLRIIEPGELTVCDTIEVDRTDERSITIAQIANTFHHNRNQASRLIGIPRLSDPWQRWARHTVAAQATN